MNGALEECYRVCRAQVRASGSNFAYAFWLLPREKRLAMEALYAFARRTDDLGDDDQASTVAKRAALVAWREELQHALVSETEEPILTALVDTVRRYQIPPRLLLDLIAGVELDLAPQRIATQAELADYAYHVAGVVGIACLYIWGFQGDAALPLAKTCGEAFQLTNILRDVREDAARNRIYLPREDLERCGYAPEELLSGVANEGFDRLMAYEIALCAARYAEAAKLSDYLTRDGRRVFRLMFGRYRAILAAIARAPRRVLVRRVSLGMPRKLWIAACELARG